MRRSRVFSILRHPQLSDTPCTRLVALTTRFVPSAQLQTQSHLACLSCEFSARSMTSQRVNLLPVKSRSAVIKSPLGSKMFTWIFIGILACGALFGEKDRRSALDGAAGKINTCRRDVGKCRGDFAAQIIGGSENDEKIEKRISVSNRR